MLRAKSRHLLPEMTLRVKRAISHDFYPLSSYSISTGKSIAKVTLAITPSTSASFWSRWTPHSRPSRLPWLESMSTNLCLTFSKTTFPNLWTFNLERFSIKITFEISRLPIRQFSYNFTCFLVVPWSSYNEWILFLGFVVESATQLRALGYRVSSILF